MQGKSRKSGEEGIDPNPGGAEREAIHAPTNGRLEIIGLKPRCE
jgi:hypothetical protein